MIDYYTVILVRDPEQPKDTDRYRAELWDRPWKGQRLAMTIWRNSRARAMKDARECFPTFELEVDD